MNQSDYMVGIDFVEKTPDKILDKSTALVKVVNWDLLNKKIRDLMDLRTRGYADVNTTQQERDALDEVLNLLDMLQQHEMQWRLP